ncbi:hypothetical protein PoB_007270200 [Plakobranchus ocellatus]|uniref:Uncharacterized protein n=1 Tax=Plakobranchus ocellatus TaxID=259542 RepID=A0AAV4DPL7_9GAST|nr:hypothetical protein PoB_007270200 [Plakobranchus ocellatus]
MQPVKFCALTVALIALCLLDVTHSKDDEQLKPCRGRQICTTLMKYKDGTVTDEAHWNVQYKLCRPLFKDKPTCKEDELGAKVETAVSEWAPELTSPRCECPGKELYRLKGWKKQGAVWEYEYVCKMDECPSDNDGKDKVECARIYVDPSKKSDKVLERKVANDTHKRLRRAMREDSHSIGRDAVSSPKTMGSPTFWTSSGQCLGTWLNTRICDKRSHHEQISGRFCYSLFHHHHFTGCDNSKLNA